MQKKIFKIINCVFWMVVLAILIYPLSLSAQSMMDRVGNVAGGSYNTEMEVTSESIAQKIGSLIQILLGFLGIIFLILMLYAGFLWMTAAGNEEKITKAKGIIKAAIIGLAIVLASYSITQFIVQSILSSTY